MPIKINELNKLKRKGRGEKEVRRELAVQA